MLKDLPRYECLLKASERYPSLDPTACEAFLNLLRAGDEVFEEEGRFFARHHISQGRFTLLMLLNRHCEEAATPASLAEQSRVTRATMTGLIDTLEKDGLVVREAGENDRRTLHVRLTPPGRDFVENMLPEYFRCVSAIIEPLDECERRQLVQLLQKIQQGLAPSRKPEERAEPLN
jgi:DNA-binding MarR family transcriptional regulator